MAKNPKIYFRLPGRGTTVSQYVRLFRGPDHLLQVYSTGYSESYKRFYYRDIQAMVIARTHTGKVWNGVWLALALSFGLPTLDTNGVTTVVLLSVAAFFLACLALNIALGPTCTCRLSTAVQVERMPSLKRLRTSRKLLRMLKPLIAAAQGELTPEEIRLKYQTGPSPDALNAAATLFARQEDPNVPPVIS